MAEGEDYLMRPILRGMCKYETLLDTAYDLEDFVLMNEALDVEGENQLRLRRAAEGKGNG